MIKCPYCNADHTHLTVDATITVTCSIDADGNIKLHDKWEHSEVEKSCKRVDEDCLGFYCDKCTSFFGAEIGYFGKVYPLPKEND